MGLNDIKLPEFIISEWYSDSLLPTAPRATAEPAAPSTPLAASPAPAEQSPGPQTPSAQTPSAQKAPTPLKFLGNNRRHIAILVNAPGTPFLPDNQLTFLTKILEACSMTLADVAIVNNATAQTSISRVKEQLNPKTTLLFGLEPSTLRLPIHFPPFKPLDYDGCTYLSAPGMEELVPNTDESKLLKSKLWVCLKTIFHV